MKKSIALLLSLCMLLCGCNTAQNPDADTSDAEPEPIGSAMELGLSCSCRSEQYLEDTDLGFCYRLEDRLLFTTDTGCMLYDTETGESVRRELHYSDGYDYLKGYASHEDTIEILWQTEDEAGQTVYLLVTYDTALNELSQEDMTEAYGSPIEIFGWERTADGAVYFTAEGSLYRYTEEKGLEDSGQSCSYLYQDAQGELYTLAGSTQMPYHIDTQTLTAEKLDVKGIKSGSTVNYASGSGGYALFFYDADGVWGVNTQTQETVQVIGWEDSDFTGNRSQFSCMLPDGRYLIRNGRSGIYTWWALTPRTQEEVDSFELITMVSPITPEDVVLDTVHQFNRQNDQYRIVMEFYSDYDLESGNAKLEAELLKGNVPDIICGGNYQILSNKDLFEDLRPWMDKDSDFNKNDYLANFFDALSYRGRLEQMSFRFRVNSFMTRTDNLDGKTELTPADYLAWERSVPDGKMLIQAERQFMLYGWILPVLPALTDYEKGTCHFDTEEFADILSLCGRIPSILPEWDADGLREGRVLMSDAALNSLWAYHELKMGNFGGADVTLLGAPVVEGNGNGAAFEPVDTMQMSAQSKYKEQIWELFKLGLSNEMQSISYFGTNSYGFPVRRRNLESYMLEDTERENTEVYVGTDELPKDIGTATMEEYNLMLDYLEQVQVCSRTDSKLWAIIEEEAEKYFAGDQSASGAAGAIQGRASIYLSEQS